MHETLSKEEIEKELEMGNPQGNYVYGDFYPVTTSIQYYMDYVTQSIQAGRFPDAVLAMEEYYQQYLHFPFAPQIQGMEKAMQHVSYMKFIHDSLSENAKLFLNCGSWNTEKLSSDERSIRLSTLKSVETKTLEKPYLLHVFIGQEAYKYGDLYLAIDHFQEALLSNPSLLSSSVLLGNAQFSLGNIEGAWAAW
eukprot:CAMPEP_0201538466 /NCGR_PEP_ID=MMETSP0161_2-20130828/67687_1 /ASSEMBLY_ACC=CAM_ASM_000251 /TAXON_ID=180227 /ORGANISM="Neoparamoeba aestuarina, Strain SoJaBio B1-5/56/2" /LENGTH=193 /DNA_ID=CAMNT_0047945307 /DNA_START=27 /DNA_END=605 /DNA_ORIENTATION=+